VTESEQIDPDISVIIPSYNTADAVLEAARSVLEHTSAALELIVVDDCSTDGTAARIRADCAQAQVHVQPKRSGFAAACNAGISRARAPLILLLNSDIIVNDDAIDRMIMFMSESGADACGCRLVAPDGTPQPYSIRVPTVRQAIQAALGLTTMPDEPRDGPAEVECLQGSCLMMTRDAIELIGRWDDGFFLYCEDIDWCIRARNAGLRLFYLPQIVMVHHRGLSTSAEFQRLTVQYHRSIWRLYRKHFAAQHGAIANGLTFVGLVTRCAVTLIVNIFRKRKSPRW